MIDLIKNNDFQNREMDYPYHAAINGIKYDGAGVNVKDYPEGKHGIFELEITDTETANTFLELPLRNFYLLQEVTLYDYKHFNNFSLNVKINLFPNLDDKKKLTTFTILPDFPFWSNKFSFADYQERFFNILSSKFSDLQLVHGNNKYNEFTEIVLFVLHRYIDRKLKEELEKYVNSILETHKEAFESLKVSEEKNSVLTQFNFPENLKFSCEQYLLYFAQFLQDLGINATSNLKEEAGKVLFSVTPTDDVEALDKIREALAVYLNLPSSPIIYDDSFAAMRLQQQIENLHHSQKMATRELQFNEKLLVAQSEMIHEKNVTISQLQSNNEQLIKIVEKISSPTIMMDSVENKEELEELYDGVKVGESETLKKWLGISLNPAKAIKTAVRNTFGKEENKSILGLDEETDDKDKY